MSSSKVILFLAFHTIQKMCKGATLQTFLDKWKCLIEFSQDFIDLNKRKMATQENEIFPYMESLFGVTPIFQIGKQVNFSKSKTECKYHLKH